MHENNHFEKFLELPMKTTELESSFKEATCNVTKITRRSSCFLTFFKTGVLKNFFAILTGKHLSWSLFLIKLRPQALQRYLKETPKKVFSYEYCKIFQNNFFMDYLWSMLLNSSWMCYSDFQFFSWAVTAPGSAQLNHSFPMHRYYNPW